MISKRKAAASLIFNTLIFVITVAVVISYFFEEPGPLIQNGYESFRFFTTDSNILVAAASLVIALCDIMILKNRTDTIPKGVILFKFVGTACVFLTFSVTLLFLLPQYGPIVYKRTLTIVHVTNPLMALFSLIFLETSHKLRLREILIGVVPMFIYGIIYLIEVVVVGTENGGWKDFYGFNQNGQWYFSIILMTVGSFAASAAVAVLHNLRALPKKDKFSAEDSEQK